MTDNTPLNADDVYNAEAWKDGFQAGYDQVILEMLYWLSETKRKTIPAKWVTSRQRKFDDDRHMNYDSYRKKHELQARIDTATDILYGFSRTYKQEVTDSSGNVYVNESHGYISRYEVQELVEKLKQELEKL